VSRELSDERNDPVNDLVRVDIPFELKTLVDPQPGRKQANDADRAGNRATVERRDLARGERAACPGLRTVASIDSRLTDK
jgi:hypothetical protein